MNRKIGKRLVAAALVLVAIVAIGQPAHAQTLSAQYDRASYVPGDSGTMTISVVNTSPTSTLELRNVTIYFPWAQLVNGKWPTSGANVTNNLSPWPGLGSLNSGSNVFTWSTPFTIPSWYGGSILGGGASNCPDSGGPRYSSSYHGCIIVGITHSPTPNYDVSDLSINMALASYTPTSIISQWLPIATLVVLIIATAFLALAWISIRRMAKK